jgi:hypothetical protein
MTRQEFEKLLTVVERNTERISRLEDVFALQVRQRAEVADALHEIRALLAEKRSTGRSRTSSRRSR